MDKMQFVRIEELFHAALERPENERDAYVLLSESDPALRAEVLRLLALHADSDDVLRAVLVDATSAPAPQQVGPYRIVRELGAGGMGTVYMVERKVGQVSRQLALKLIRGFPTAAARERFARECSLLAGLDHPNIARLVDAGDHDTQPYLVMEYVEGLSLREFCNSTELSLPGRLRLFAQLCRAVQHAHQRLIVHRDIKPSNILVRADGTPVLLDFGIGKLLDVSKPETTVTRVFTPAYAAPEQRAGRATTTAVDIFSLGCVLFELLCDQSIAEIADSVRPIPAPSTRVKDRARARALRGDLDTLVLKATHGEPERRYASAQALVEDVENFLGGKPLEAVQDSQAYRLRKFCQRHRFGVSVAVLALLASGIFVWRLGIERQRAIVAEARAEQDARSARGSRDFLVSMFEQAAPENTLGRPLTARELIDKGSEKLRVELKGEPETAARLHATIAQVYAALGDPKAAISSGERALALAVGDTSERALLRADILLILSSEYDNTERFLEARRAGEEALMLRERYAPDDRAKIATMLSALGHAAVRRGELELGRGYFNHATDEYDKLQQVEPGSLAEVYRGLAEIDVQQGRFVEGMGNAQMALSMLATLPAMSPERIDTLRVLAGAQSAGMRADIAVATLEHALLIARATLGEENTKVANIENDLAVALNSVGRYREAIPHLRTSIAINEKMRPNEQIAAAFDRGNLGSIYESLGDYAQAERLMRDVIATIERDTPDDPQLDTFRSNLARTLMLRGDLDGARSLIERGLAGIAMREGEASFGYAFQSFRLARVELAAGDPDAAEQALDGAWHTLDSLLPPQHAVRVQFSVLRGLIARDRGRLELAQSELEAAEEAQLALPNDDPVMLAALRSHLAGVYLARNDLLAAQRKLDAALPVLERSLLPTAVERVDASRHASELARRKQAAPGDAN